MEVQIISREIIKPAELEEQKIYELSALDICNTLDSYTPVIFFYKRNKLEDDNFNREDEIASLKLSLSRTLALFPMLAGRIKGNLIQCSNEDSGVLFIEATVKVTMADFLKTPNTQLLGDLLPFPHIVLMEPMENAVQVAAQVNFFSCGGIAMGLSFLHKIIDGTSMSAFTKCWAAINKGEVEKIGCGSYNASSLFPGRYMMVSDSVVLPVKTPFTLKQGENSTTRRFVFDAMAISNLKARTKSETVPNPTSVEAVSCFIWKYAMKATRSKLSLDDDKKEVVAASKWGSMLVHTVNMRRRIQPPLSEYEIGNIIWASQAYYEAPSSKDYISSSSVVAETIKLADLEVILKQSLLEINNDFMQKATREDGREMILNSLAKLMELYAKSSESYTFTSWRNMGLNEVNFRWGKPIWTSIGGNTDHPSLMKNLVTLLDTAMGDGIEAWLALDQKTMELLQNDDEFLEFASPHPPIIY